MKMILTIGYEDYIVPDGVNALKLYEMLGKLRPCKDQSYMRENAAITVHEKMVHLEIKSIATGTKIVQAKRTAQEITDEAIKAADEDIPL